MTDLNIFNVITHMVCNYINGCVLSAQIIPQSWYTKLNLKNAQLQQQQQ